MNRENVITQVNEVMSRGFEIPSEKLKPEAVLRTDLGLDSLDAVDMLVLLEEKLGTKVEGEKLMQIQTLDDVYNLIFEHVSTVKM
jgi:acyl carrier protein